MENEKILIDLANSNGQFRKGAFLTTRNGDKTNVMTISWGLKGFLWNSPIFMVAVRKSRYTYELIEASNEFTVSLPDGDFVKELKMCGCTSGREINKLIENNLTTRDAKKIKTPIINCNGTHFECSIIHKSPMEKSKNNTKYIENLYLPDDDFHVLYFGQIVDEYVI